MKNGMCDCGFLEEIHGFETPGEYDKFIVYLKTQIAKGNLERVASDDNYEKGLIYGGEWFRCLVCNEIWRIVPPDFPFRGLWEKVLLGSATHKDNLD